METHIRWMIRRDMPEVLATDLVCFPTARWEEEDYLRCLRQRNCIGMVAELGEQVIGHMLYELHKEHLDLVRLAVCPRYWRQGIGRQLIAKLVSKLSSHRRCRIKMDVPEGLLAAQLWLRAVGFKAIRVIRQGADDGSDVYRMEYRLPQDQPVCSGK